MGRRRSKGVTSASGDRLARTEPGDTRGVVVVHDRTGKVLRRYTLRDLLGAKPTAAAPSTVSSIWWRCGTSSLVAGGQVLRVTTHDEDELRIGLRDGCVAYAPGKGRCLDGSARISPAARPPARPVLQPSPPPG